MRGYLSESEQLYLIELWRVLVAYSSVFEQPDREMKSVFVWGKRRYNQANNKTRN